jgi:hypothetical protein
LTTGGASWQLRAGPSASGPAFRKHSACGRGRCCLRVVQSPKRSDDLPTAGTVARQQSSDDVDPGTPTLALLLSDKGSHRSAVSGDHLRAHEGRSPHRTQKTCSSPISGLSRCSLNVPMSDESMTRIGRLLLARVTRLMAAGSRSRDACARLGGVGLCPSMLRRRCLPLAPDQSVDP